MDATCKTTAAAHASAAAERCRSKAPAGGDAPPRLLLDALRAHAESTPSKRLYTWLDAKGREAVTLDAAIRAARDDRVLLESDAASARALPRAGARALALVAAAKGWSETEAARVTSENALRFLDAGEETIYRDK